MPKSSEHENALLLDTHCWIWMQTSSTEHLSRTARRAIEAAAGRGELLLSAISVWELGMLEVKGRIQLRLPCLEWVRAALDSPGLSVMPLTPEIAIDSSRLPGEFHGDPADRIIVATARSAGARLLTADRRILDYGVSGYAEVLPA
jgi:PIN domain nuclease of toxin-antitoxin system